MTAPMSNTDLKTLSASLIKQFLIWLPIIVGLVHQLLMFFFCIDRIYVFLKPPEYLSPFVTLELQWWLVLVLITSVLCVLAARSRLQPHRLVYPFYLYLLFLLIFVKPIEPLNLFCAQ